MALALQLAHSLPVVRVSLSQIEDDPAVKIQLVVNEEGLSVVHVESIHSLTALGFAPEIEHRMSSAEFDVPLSIANWVGEWLHARLIPAGGGTMPPALWIHLVKPYGMLGGVPWERRLQPACGIPVLRLPDMLPTAGRTTTTYEVALCATAPSENGLSSVLRILPYVADGIARGVGGRLRLHVFVEAAAAPFAHDARFSVSAHDVVIHDAPATLQDQSTRTSPMFDSAWLRWIREATSGRVLDAVHFIAHGCTLGTDGALLTSLSPTAAGGSFPYALQAGQLRAFLTAVGAVAAGFTAAPNNTSPYGLRRFVDDLGALRAGPVFLHDATSAVDISVLARTYQLLSSPMPERAPADLGLVLFVQPGQIRGLERPKWAFAERIAPRTIAMEEHLRRAEPPLWVAASEQYIRERQAELVRFRESTGTEMPTSAQTAYYAGVATALRRIQTVLDKHAEASL